jgi:hypothetical protein
MVNGQESLTHGNVGRLGKFEPESNNAMERKAENFHGMVIIHTRSRSRFKNKRTTERKINF